ncbi:hypothetical protein RB594_002311 [Gaeumannomyces avenae]
MPVRSRGDPGTENGLEIFCSVEQVTEPLRPVALVDALATALLAELHHAGRQLVHRVVHALGPAIYNVDAVVARVLNQLLHVAAKARQVGRDAGHTHDGALGRRVSPRLIVGRKDAQMRAAHKVVVVQRQHRVGRVQELRVEDDLDTVRGVVEQLHASDLVQNGVVVVVHHVVRDNGREPMPLHGKQAPPQKDTVLAGNQFLLVGERVPVVPLERALEDATTDAPLDNIHRVSQRLDDGLSLQGLNRERQSLRGHDDEGHNRRLAPRGLQAVVQAGQSLDKHVASFVPELVPTSREKIQRVLWLKIVMPVEVAADKVVDLLLGLRVQVLELVHSGELGHVQAVGQDTVRLALQQVLALVRRDMGYGREHIARVRRGALDAVPVVDAPLARLGVDVEPLQVVVEVDRPGAKVTSKKGGVCGENEATFQRSAFHSSRYL